MATDTNTNTNDAERVSTVHATRVADKPAERVRARRHTDEAIIEATCLVLAAHPTMGWVEALRSIRWSAGVGCDYKRYKPLFAVANERMAAAEALAARKRKPRARKTA